MKKRVLFWEDLSKGKGKYVKKYLNLYKKQVILGTCFTHSNVIYILKPTSKKNQDKLL